MERGRNKNQEDAIVSQTGSLPAPIPLRSFGSIMEYDGHIDLEHLSKEIPKGAYIFNGGNTHIVIAIR